MLRRRLSVNKRLLMAIPVMLLIIFALSSLVLAKTSYGEGVMGKFKSLGYIAYTPDEAIELAYTKCAQCHNVEEKIAKYCFSCGPPFIVQIHFMRIILKQEMWADVPRLTDAEAVAITQVWNALVGNWEKYWRKQDLIKLLQDDRALIDLLNTPLEERKLEIALEGKKAAGAYRRY